MEVFSSIRPIIDNSVCKVMQLASFYSEQKMRSSSTDREVSFARPWFQNLSDRLESMVEPVCKNGSLSSPEIWEDQIIPLSQNVYKQIKLLQEIIPIDCKYSPNALYKEYLMNLERYLDRVSESLPHTIPFESTLNCLKGRGVVCINCEGLNSPRYCDSCSVPEDKKDERIAGTSTEMSQRQDIENNVLSNEDNHDLTCSSSPAMLSRGLNFAGNTSSVIHGSKTVSTATEGLSLTYRVRAKCSSHADQMKQSSANDKDVHDLATHSDAVMQLKGDPDRCDSQLQGTIYAGSVPAGGMSNQSQVAVETPAVPIIESSNISPVHRSACLSDMKRSFSEPLDCGPPLVDGVSAKKLKVDETRNKMYETGPSSWDGDDNVLDDPSAWDFVDKVADERQVSRLHTGGASSSTFPLTQPSSSLPIKEVVCNVRHNCPHSTNSSLHSSSHPESSYRCPSILRSRDSRPISGTSRTVNFTDPPVSHMYGTPDMSDRVNCMEPSSSLGMQRMLHFSDPQFSTAPSFCGGSSGSSSFIYRSPSSCQRSQSQNTFAYQPSCENLHSSPLFQQTCPDAPSSTVRGPTLLYPTGPGYSCNQRFGDYRRNDCPPTPSRYHNHQYQTNFNPSQREFNGSFSSGSGSRFSGSGSHASANSESGRHPSSNLASLDANNVNPGNNKPPLFVRESSEKEVAVMDWINEFLPSEFGRRFF